MPVDFLTHRARVGFNNILNKKSIGRTYREQSFLSLIRSLPYMLFNFGPLIMLLNTIILFLSILLVISAVFISIYLFYIFAKCIFGSFSLIRQSLSIIIKFILIHRIKTNVFTSILIAVVTIYYFCSYYCVVILNKTLEKCKAFQSYCRVMECQQPIG